MPSPTASIVVPSRGGAARLPILLDALARQETDVQWEVVVVLDGDIDGSRAVLESSAQRLRLEVVELAENRGRSAALNAGFLHARGDVLIRCDDDLVPRRDYVARHVGRHGGDAIGVVGLYRNIFPDTPYARVYGRHWDERFRRDAYAAGSCQAWRYWAGNCSVTRETWARVGPYDSAFRAYGYEDVDWGYRLARLGISVTLDPALEIEHRIAATTTRTRAQRAFYSGAAKWHFEQKHRVDERPSPPLSAWDRLVTRLAARLSERRAVRFGGAVDHTVPLLPVPVSRRAVALAVEAAARAGYARGRTGGMI